MRERWLALWMRRFSFWRARFFAWIVFAKVDLRRESLAT